MIYLENLNKYYLTRLGRHYVFKDVNISLPTDRNIALLGPNGAGKTTLIRMMGGADIPDRGRIHSKQNISWPLGIQGGLQGSMTARENVRFVARIHGYKNTRPIEQQVEEFADIGKFFDEPVKNYSSGMKSRISFALTMGFDFDFDVLLIDELGAVGDADFKKKSEKVLLEKYEKTKLIMVSHSIAALRKFCDAGVLIRKQKLVFFENVDEAIQAYQDIYVK